MTKLSVTLFGGPAVRVGDESIPLSRYEASLVAILFGHGPRGLSRVRAIKLLWGPPGSVERHRLSQLLYKLNRKLGESCHIEVSDDRIRAATGSVTCDLQRFETALVHDRLTEAAAVLEPGFLSRISSPPTEDFDLWRDGKALAARRSLRERAASLWSGARPDGNWSAAREAAEVMILLEPSDERALRRVLLSRAMVGKVHEADAAYRAFAERCQGRGESWDPDPETLELVERVRSLETTPAEGRPLRVAPEPEIPLCGRDAELALLSSYVSTVPRKEPTCVLISGEGGIGKTRLFDETVVAATLSGILILRGRSSEFERDIPLNPLLEALNHPVVERALSRLDNPWRTVMLALMPQFHAGEEQLEDLGYIQPGSIPRRLFEAFHRLLLEVVKEQTVCLFVDDLHWADETSLKVLDFLRRRWTTGGLSLVFAVRPEILRPGSPWARFQSELGGSRNVESLELDELTGHAAEALVDVVAQPALPRRLVRELCALSGHNPFFLIELTLEYLAGRFEPGGGVGGVLRIPLSIVQVFEQRLDLLSRPAAKLCNTLAVLNSPVKFEDAHALGGLSLDATLACLDELSQLRLVQCTNNTIRLRHPLLRECIYSQLGPTRCAWLHKEVAAYLEQASETSSIEELALHFHRAGSADKARRFAEIAADRAEAAGAIPEALQYWQIVRQNSDEGDVRILQRLARLNFLFRNLSEAGPLFRIVANRFRDQGDLEASLEAEVLAIDALSQRTAPAAEEVLGELRRIRSTAQEAEYWKALARAIDVEVRLLGRLMMVDRLLELLIEARRLADQGPPQAQCWIHAALALAVTTEPGEATLSAVKRGVAIARDAGLRAELLTLLSRLVAVMIPLGRLGSHEGQEALHEAELLAKDSGDLFQRFNIRTNHGVWLMEAGFYDQARVRFAEAQRIIADTEARTAQVILDYNLGELFLREGRYGEATQSFGRAESNSFPGVPEFGPHMISAGIGLCELELGHLREARRRESSLIQDQPRWAFNPLIVIMFRSRLLDRRGERRSAADYLAGQATPLRERRLPTWIQLKLEEARVRRTFDVSGSQEILETLAPIISSHGLDGLESRIRQLQRR